MARYQITTGLTILAMLGVIPRLLSLALAAAILLNSRRLCVNRQETRMQD
jgi:hypothetical protein